MNSASSNGVLFILSGSETSLLKMCTPIHVLLESERSLSSIDTFYYRSPFN